jgi:hypothetical protein
VKELLLKLLLRLEAIGEQNEEISDTVCRDAMAEAVFCSFLLPEPGYELPYDFGLCSPEANQAVREALREYITAARELAPQEGLTTFQQRLAALQDADVITESGSTHDEFFGYFVPSLYTENGDWLG